MNYLVFSGFLLLVFQHCSAQSGYNYVRPEVALGISNNPVNIAQTATTNPLRPIVGGFSTGTTAAGTYPTGTTAFGGGPNVIPTTAYGAYGGEQQQQRTSIPSATAGGFPATGVGGSLQKRPNLPQRSGSGIYGAGLTSAGQPQFSSTGRGTGNSGSGSGLDGGDYDGDYSAIPGVPGVDYPIYSQVPQTNFDCAQQPLPGYYSNVEAQCQVFHICALNRTYSFLCPNGTVFSQETLVCVWWNQYDCATAPSLYANNAFIYDYGGERVPTNSAFQGGGGQGPIGIGGGSSNAPRQLTNFGVANTGRTPTATTAGIYGAGSIRPTLAGGGFQGQVPTSNFNSGGGVTPGSSAGVRFTPATAQTFPTASAVVTPASPFGAVLRGGGSSNIGGIQDVAYPNAQVATSSTNREYLPPPSRRNQRHVGSN